LPENIFLNGSNFAILGFILFYFGKEIIAFFKKDKIDENKQMEMYINATTSQTDKLINKISDNNNSSFSALVDAMKEFTTKQNHLVEAIQELAKNVEELGGVDLEALKAENNTLKQRVTTLENLLDGLILKLKKAFVI
jgi:uncharacterized protein YukE